MSKKNSSYILPNHKEEASRKGMVERLDYRLNDAYKAIGTKKQYVIKTYGCQANVRDSETIAGILEMTGFTKAEYWEQADVIIFNTCAVRKAAEDHVFGEIGSLKHFKEQHPHCVIALCGCMAQEETTVETVLDKYPQIDLIFGTHNIYRLPEYLAKALQGQRVIEVYSGGEGNVVEQLPVNRSKQYKAFINIMYGCDKFCTYCIVPYTRGKQRSRKKEAIIEEVKQFIQQGGKEVTLLGQNVNAYGKDLGLVDGFTDLLIAVAQTGVQRIRFYSSSPKDYQETTIDAMVNYPNIMPSLHLPVQSGSNEILKKMNRGYTVEEYKKLYDTMKAKMPFIAFTTDIIVGFPMESEAQFQKTLDLVDYCQFDSVFSFVYSPREGTPASMMKDTISLEEKKQRLQRLNKKIAYYGNKNNRQYVHRVVTVLCDGRSKKNKDVYSGYSEENKLVNFVGENVNEGDIVKVQITQAKSFSLDGKLVK